MALQVSAGVRARRGGAEAEWAAVERRAAGNTGAGGHLVADYESLGAALGAVAQVLERDVDGRYAA
ncbi:MAG: hypothetical protein ACRCSN_05815, partial [Dermatophilaceae bacterium]